jgi:hypothetical protein
MHRDIISAENIDNDQIIFIFRDFGDLKASVANIMMDVSRRYAQKGKVLFSNIKDIRVNFEKINVLVTVKVGGHCANAQSQDANFFKLETLGRQDFTNRGILEKISQGNILFLFIQELLAMNGFAVDKSADALLIINFDGAVVIAMLVQM